MKNYDMVINTRLSVNGCWKMVNAIQNGRTPADVRQRCNVAEKWIRANEIINNNEYDDLMMTISWLYRESYHTA